MADSNSLPLFGRVAVVTGASRGIGRAIALELGKQGASIAVNYLSSPEKAEEVAAEIHATGGAAIAVRADVSDTEQAGTLIKATIDQLGGLDILVNNAGIIRDGLIMMMKEEDWDAVITTNLKSTFNCSKAAVRHMIRKRYGRIVNISSVAGLMGNPGQTNYSASKAGQIGFAKALAREVASRNITVNVVAPGFVETEIIETTRAEAIQAVIANTPIGRLAQPEEVAYAVSFLVSERAGYITGQVLNVDGGLVMD
ncbi:MAG TPA: 3-oxoacyl-[acyl-carrier-protein] reductase [Anaerolineales bacterium]|nr:3-oxoacyl-[acyl-carrier-protein] reductase [Anaerolineales bacterium]